MASSTPQQMDDVSQSKLLYELYDNLEAEGLDATTGQSTAPISNNGGAGSGDVGGGGAGGVGGENKREQMQDNFVPQPPMRENVMQNSRDVGQVDNNGQGGQGDEDEIIEEYYIEEPEDTRTAAKKVFDEVKTPLLVFGIFFVLSLRFLDRQMSIYIPSTVNDYRRLNFFGILLKSVLAGLLFFVFNKYVLTRF